MIPEKNAELTDRLTDQQRLFYRTLCRTGVQQPIDSDIKQLRKLAKHDKVFYF